MFKGIYKTELVLLSSLLIATNAHADLSTRTPFVATGKVAKVVDGDTAYVALSDKYYAKFRAMADTKQKLRAFKDNNNTVKVRLGGINTPESVHANKKMNTQAGKLASQWAKDNFYRHPVTLRCWDFGRYGRPICSIQTEHGNKDWGLEAIKAGHSDYITKYGKHPFLHSKYRVADM
ncbi:thermonuclease family protein [Photobacterium leiognathi]|uniref:thermonuclease family protein n=1 Tax=Photobacterium leiognathi TaxID=553611 RepID=UPI002736A360|nr:thermonuclease family protein [Photobacterium leiognathi]